MQALLKQRVVVLSGLGAFSRRVATGVAEIPRVECVLGLPPGPRSMNFASSLGLPFIVLDPNEPASLQRLLEGAFAVVNALGPFQTRDHLAIAARCAALGVHYIDPADNREYMAEFMRLGREAREHGALLVTGAGAAPAVTGALTGLLLSDHFTRINEIHIFVTPGMGDQRELAIARSILAHSGPLRVKQGGRWREQHWWEQPLTVRFPDPIGRRRGYLCDLPELELFTKHFEARTVTTRAGFAPGMLNRILSGLASMRRNGKANGLSRTATALVRVAARMTSAHANTAAVRVAVQGLRRGVEEEHVVCLVGRDGAGPAIAAAPILALLHKWLDHGVRDDGAVTCVGLLKFEDLKPSLVGHDVVLVRE
jgi:saccharopine dehydrogenase-like NADP-dependent oxidoreductase